MRLELETELYNIDPIFFSDAIDCLSGKKTEMDTCMAFGCECGDGWFEPLKTFVKKIKIINDIASKYNTKYICEQLKEKYGEIRVYYSVQMLCEENDKLIITTLSEMFQDALTKLEEECWDTCERCGSKSKIVTTSGWISRICNKCAEQEENNRIENLDKKLNQEYIPRIVNFNTCYKYLHRFDNTTFIFNKIRFNSIWSAYYYNLFLDNESLKDINETFKYCDANPKHYYYLGRIIQHKYQIKNNDDLMREILEKKYGFYYKQELIDTNDKKIIYNVYDCDNYWFVCLCDKCQDKKTNDDNHLGKLIEEVREKLKKGE